VLTLGAARQEPGKLEKVAEALGLPGKDAEGHKIMKRMAQPRRARKGEDPAHVYWVDSPELRERLYRYCMRDVEVERALYRRLPPLSLAEQRLWELDATINERGFHVDVALAQAARNIVFAEQAAINTEIAGLTAGEITSINQIAKIQAFVQRNGHALQSVTKKSVAAVLAGNPNDTVRRVLELRRDGARASANKLDSLLAGVDEDNRLRGTLRFHGAATGRWSGSRYQPQNMKKPEGADIDAALAAVRAGDLARVRELGAPLSIVGDISRAMICAAPRHVLIGADFSAIESRVLAWIAGETWKLETYRKYNATGNPELEPYCVMASQALRRTVTPEDKAGRQFGKTYDLAFGFGGGLGAWRKFDGSSTYTDAEIEAFKNAFRSNHAATVRFWRALENAAIRCVGLGERIALERITFDYADGTLYLTLPSGRRLAYPQARLEPGKFEGTRQISYKDNASGGWSDCATWYGTLVENVVQATARDLLATAMLRLEAAGYRIAFHVHDEIVCEVPHGFGNTEELLRIMLELPQWANDLPIAAKPWTGTRYAKTKAPELAEISGSHVELVPDSRIISRPTQRGDAICEVNLADLISAPAVDGKVCCPFHADGTPSCHIYADHFHCFGCGAHGNAIDWLMMVEGLDRAGAIQRIETWGAQCAPQRVAAPVRNKVDYTDAALRLWEEAKPIAGTLAEKYLAEVRRIDVAALPTDVDEALRFHPRCPFNGGQGPCLVALMRDAATGAATGIHRTALAADGSKIDRRTLGRLGVLKLWPAGSQLVVGEGIETVLAAATRVSYRGAPLRPAWATLAAGSLSKLQLVPGVERLIILVDHDLNGAGQAAANSLALRWRSAGRGVAKLTPSQPGADFNDIVKGVAS
jgi:CHC2-type zinc finger protein/Toprim domain-containing protein